MLTHIVLFRFLFELVAMAAVTNIVVLMDQATVTATVAPTKLSALRHITLDFFLA